MYFPTNFTWGAASSAYQVEGGASVRGPNIWDEFCARQGAVWGGQSGEPACDHVRRYRDDVALMREMGLRAYRFSISWARVIPGGVGEPSQPGLAFYDSLVDELLRAGIEPWVTLYHWDLPSALQARGGWLNREIADWFGGYARAVVDRLADRVTRWITINEPQIFVPFGHGSGVHAPGLKLSMAEQLLAGHHALLAHGRAVEVIRERSRAPAFVGWAPIGRVRFPATDSSADISAAREATGAVLQRDFWNNTWFGDPVCLGRYPEDGLRVFGPDVPRGHERDMARIRQKLDFYGLNIYDGEAYRRGPDGAPQSVAFAPGHPQTALKWFVTPQALRWGPVFLHERYGLPLVITENGISNADWPDAEGRVHDPQRIDYTRAYLLSLAQAIGEGVDVRGYFHWSILDNFEWQEGYKERFGLVHVDYATQARTVKDSGRWYGQVARTNGASLLATARA